MTDQDSKTMTQAIPTTTDRQCTICNAVVAAFPEAMCCHCQTVPWRAKEQSHSPTPSPALPSEERLKAVETAIIATARLLADDSQRNKETVRWIRVRATAFANAAIAAMQATPETGWQGVERRGIIRNILYRHLPTELHADVCRAIADEIIAAMTQGWQGIETAPRGGGNAKFLVTNNISARDAHGHMSHVWLVSMIHDQPDGEVVAFKEDGYTKAYNLSHWAPISEPPASDLGKAKPETGVLNDDEVARRFGPSARVTPSGEQA